MTAKKILHMHFGKEGGAERFFVNLVQAFGERGLEQRFVTRPGRIWKPEIAALGPIIEDHYRRLSLTTPILTLRVHGLVRRWRPDVVMAWMSRASRLIPNDAHAFKLTRLGDLPRHIRHFRYNDCIVSNVPEIADKCRALGFTKPVHLISNFPREVTPVPAARSELSTPDDAFVISGVGRFVGRKGFDTLVRAAARIPDAWLWLVGEGPEREALEKLVADLGIAERTRFTGWVDEPIHLIAASDAFVMPSRHEPLGNVVLESWLAGVPAVSTRTGGPSWFVVDGEDALLTDIGDDEAMAAAITRIRDDADLRARLIAAGAAKLEARFTKERVVEQYLALFDRGRGG